MKLAEFKKIGLFYLIILLSVSCKKFISVDAPITTTNSDIVYSTDATAAAVLTGIYSNISLDNGTGLTGFGGGFPLLTLYSSLSADELTLYSGSYTNQLLLGYYRNALTSRLTGPSNDFWIKIYSYVYTINSAISGLTNSSTLTAQVKSQLLGEAYFLRAFSYFYLVNLYGDVPLVLSTNYLETAKQPRNTTTEIYSHIKSDLIKAQSLLNDNYVDGSVLINTEERVRPNKATAIALLARTYLYMNDWANAEQEATKIIDNIELYGLVSLNDVFLKNSKESIWCLQPVRIAASANTGEGRLFILPSSGPASNFPVYLSEDVVSVFEKGDQRLLNWVDSVTAFGVKYHYPYKYKIGSVNVPTSEYSVVFRLAEQYLIRSESRIQQNKITDGIADLNTLRSRATNFNMPADDQLSQINPTISKINALKATAHERQVELFTEWGHRWLDLKRTNAIDSIMSIATQNKGGIWDSRSQLYPIPLAEIQRDAKLKQNPNY
jgi:starch-binding outer membrane protein, SusD/RagB family